MTIQQLKSKLQTTNRTSEEIDEIVSKFEKSIVNRNAMKIQYKSIRNKIHDMMNDYNLDRSDCRFFSWCEGIGIFVHRNLDENKATVSFSFLNPEDDSDILTDSEARINYRYYSLLNFILNRYTYTVDWKGRSEFAVYDAFLKHHNEFPSTYKDLKAFIGLY